MKYIDLCILVLGVVLWGLIAIAVVFIKEIDDISYWSVIILANMYLIGLILYGSINRKQP